MTFMVNGKNWPSFPWDFPVVPKRPRPEAIALGDPKGVKAAAVRKLGHELGIPSVRSSDFFGETLL